MIRNLQSKVLRDDAKGAFALDVNIARCMQRIRAYGVGAIITQIKKTTRVHENYCSYYE